MHFLQGDTKEILMFINHVSACVRVVLLRVVNWQILLFSMFSFFVFVVFSNY